MISRLQSTAKSTAQWTSLPRRAQRTREELKAPPPEVDLPEEVAGGGVGAGLTLAGILLMVIPGPGLLVFFFGLSTSGSEGFWIRLTGMQT
jgi:hypothetical protein